MWQTSSIERVMLRTGAWFAFGGALRMVVRLLAALLVIGSFAVSVALAEQIGADEYSTPLAFVSDVMRWAAVAGFAIVLVVTLPLLGLASLVIAAWWHRIRVRHRWMLEQLGFDVVPAPSATAPLLQPLSLVEQVLAQSPRHVVTARRRLEDLGERPGAGADAAGVVAGEAPVRRRRRRSWRPPATRHMPIMWASVSLSEPAFGLLDGLRWTCLAGGLREPGATEIQLESLGLAERSLLRIGSAPGSRLAAVQLFDPPLQVWLADRPDLEIDVSRGMLTIATTEGWQPWDDGWFRLLHALTHVREQVEAVA